MREEDYIPTGHRIFRGGKRIENELMPKAMKPFVIHQPGDEEEEEAEDVAAIEEEEAADVVPAEEETEATETADASEEAAGGAAEDIAARIAGDRVKFQADILAVAREKAEEGTE